MSKQATYGGIVLAVLVMSALFVATPASAHNTRQYWTLGVPAQDNVPQSQRLYASLPTTGTPNRNGDPVRLVAGRNPRFDTSRQDWWFAEPTYPYVDNTIRGGSPHLAAIGDLWEDCFDYVVIPTGCKFEGQSGIYKVRVKLVNRYSGKCLAVQGGGAVAHNYPIIQWTCERNAHDQMWTYVLNNDAERRQQTHIEELQPFANSHTCLGPQQRTAATQLRVFGGPGICPHWVLFPALRDHRYPQRFVNPS